MGSVSRIPNDLWGFYETDEGWQLVSRYSGDLQDLRLIADPYQFTWGDVDTLLFDETAREFISNPCRSYEDFCI